MTVSLTRRGAPSRLFNGYVSEFATLAHDGALMLYRMTLVPWLWFLTRTRDCRLFQATNVPDIVRQVFEDHGFDDVEMHLGADYPVRDVCVQYRETDFDFVSRLMEHEGIFYFFRHEADKHTLVLADSNRSLDTVPGSGRIVFGATRRNGVTERMTEWSAAFQVQSGTATLGKFDWRQPSADLKVSYSRPFQHALADGEAYDYPGHYGDKTQGGTEARIRLEGLHTDFEQ